MFETELFRDDGLPASELAYLADGAALCEIHKFVRSVYPSEVLIGSGEVMRGVVMPDPI